MAEDTNETRRGFVAERRASLFASITLFLYQQAGLRFEKISILGNEVKIPEPYWISFVLWILWGYFLLRFYQYFRSMPDKGINSTYESTLKGVIKSSAFLQYKRSFVPREDERTAKPDFKIQNVNYPMTFPKFWSIKLDINVAFQMLTGVRARGDSYVSDFESWSLLWAKSQAIFHMLASSPVGTEYFLPFIVALLPLTSVFLGIFR